MSSLKLILILLLTGAALSAVADIYTPQEAFQDLASERLTFVGRDYPNSDLGPGGNYVCVYKNSRVYVRHEGCRPQNTQRLAVFSAKIISRNGGLVEIYIENSKADYRLEEAGPQMDGVWKLTSVNVPAIESELSFRDLIQLERNVWSKTYNTCFISRSPMYPNQLPETKCYGNAADPQGNLEVVWHDPLSNGLKEAHDLIIKAPRK